jgi:hypothetical protein
MARYGSGCEQHRRHGLCHPSQVLSAVTGLRDSAVRAALGSIDATVQAHQLATLLGAAQAPTRPPHLERLGDGEYTEPIGRRLR